MTLEGTAEDAKLGAVLAGKRGMLCIDGHDAWPEAQRGKRLRVTGKVIVKDDLPAFIHKPGDPIRAGIPVTSERELAKAKRRYLLADAAWVAVD